LPRRGRPLRPRGAAEARPRRRPDRVRCAAPGPRRSSRAPDHPFDRRPLPRPRLAAARRQCAFACAGRIRPGHRGGIVRRRGRTTGAGYEHDDFARRFEIPIDEPANGHAHCRQLLLSAFATLMVEDGDLVLGRWQSLFAVELDGPRQRQVALQLDGEIVRRDEKVSLEALVELELARQLMVDPEPVASPMRRLVEAGGKRLRPKLVQLTAGIGPRSDPLRAAELAAAVELLHNATLIHDDYVDESTHRRGRPTVAAAEGPERAIAVGDYYFAKATRLIAQIGNGGVTSALAEALESVCASQIDDVAMRGSYPGDRDSYMRVIRGKTASLFAAACESGALLSGAAPGVVDALGRFGVLLGTAFQMADDMVDFSPSS